MTLLLAVLVLGLSTTIWSLVGLGRVVNARARGTRRRMCANPVGPADVAVLVAAHNEELVIAATITAAAQLVDVGNIHIISDGSKDGTAAIATALGANVLELTPNRGKAGALAAGISKFDLCRRFSVVLLLDADTHLAGDYLSTGLPLFDDPEVVAVAGRARSIDRPAAPTMLGRFLVSYRERLYLIVQLLIKFGQAAKWANAVTIVPGFASMYRTSALAQIDVVGAGLVIEDFNMTFEVHAKRLGRIEFHPSAAVAYTQDPATFGEYIRQVRRWILGFWQTVRRHRLRASVFSVSLAVFIVELISSSLLFVLVIPLLVASALAGLVQVGGVASTGWTSWLAGLLTPRDVAIGIFLPDYLLTVMAAWVLRQPRFLYRGLAFPLMRILDAALCLRVLPKAWAAASSGVWVSPTRRSLSSTVEPAGAGQHRHRAS